MVDYLTKLFQIYLLTLQMKSIKVKKCFDFFKRPFLSYKSNTVTEQSAFNEEHHHEAENLVVGLLPQ